MIGGAFQYIGGTVIGLCVLYMAARLITAGIMKSLNGAAKEKEEKSNGQR